MKRRVVIGCVCGALLVAVTAWLVAVAQRPQQGGPLGGGDEAGIVVDAFYADSAITYGLQNLTNSGPDEILIEDIEILLGDPGLKILGDVWAYGPSRVEREGFNLFDVREGWPPGDHAAPLVGSTIAPSDHIGLELLIGLRVPSVDEGIGTLEGVSVAYTAGGTEYVKTFHVAMTICPRGHAGKCDEVG